MGQMPSHHLVPSLEETCVRGEVGRTFVVPISLLPVEEGCISQMRLFPAILYV